MKLFNGFGYPSFFDILKIKEGSNKRMGTATLTAGAATVNTTSVTANSRIFLTSNTDGGVVGFFGYLPYLRGRLLPSRPQAGQIPARLLG